MTTYVVSLVPTSISLRLSFISQLHLRVSFFFSLPLYPIYYKLRSRPASRASYRAFIFVPTLINSSNSMQQQLIKAVRFQSPLAPLLFPDNVFKSKIQWREREMQIQSAKLNWTVSLLNRGKVKQWKGRHLLQLQLKRMWDGLVTTSIAVCALSSVYPTTQKLL